MSWDDFAEDVKSKALPRGPRCSVGVLLGSLPSEAQEALTGVLGDQSLAIPAVARALKDRVGGVVPSVWALSNHRRGKCACPR